MNRTSEKVGELHAKEGKLPLVEPLSPCTTSITEFFSQQKTKSCPQS